MPALNQGIFLFLLSFINHRWRNGTHSSNGTKNNAQNVAECVKVVYACGRRRKESDFV